MHKRTVATVLAALSLSCVYAHAGEFESALKELERQAHTERLKSASPAKSSAAEPDPLYYAEKILSGSKSERIQVDGTDSAGTRAIVTRTDSMESIKVFVATRGPRGWQTRHLISRDWGKEIDRPLEVQALSTDGRFALIGYREDLKDLRSWGVRVLDVDSGEITILSKNEAAELTVFGRNEQFKSAVTASEWLKTRYGGSTYQDVFPQKTRGCPSDGVTLTAKDSLVLTEGSEPTTYPLKNLINAEFGMIGNWATAYGADCRRGFVIVTEINSGHAALSSVVFAIFNGAKMLDPNASNLGAYSRDHLIVFAPAQ